MAVTAHTYNHTTKLFTNQEVDLDNLKLMLLNDSASFDATDTTVDAVAGAASPHRANEVYGNGWTEGGEDVASVAGSTITTNDAKLSGDQTSKTATGGSIGPAFAVLLYDATSSKPLIYWDLGTVEGEEAGDTTDFKITFDLTGTPGTIFTISNPE